MVVIMKKKRIIFGALICLFSVAISGCSNEKISEDEIKIKTDFSKIIDPPLIKKIAMYNAGCINPLTNYDRDLGLIQALNPESLRIDLSIGKPYGTGGEKLVTSMDGNLVYDFSQLDAVVKKINAQNVLPYMSWCYIPAPLQENGQWNNLDTSKEDWKKIWYEIYYNYAKHYVDSNIQIGYHEIYNEPDLEYLKEWGVFDKNFEGFLKIEDFIEAYLDMYEYGSKAILEADPDASIGGPAYAMGEILDWTGIIARVKEKSLPMDFFSFHSYLDGDTWPKELYKVVSELATSEYFNTTAIHINEFTQLNNENGANKGLESPFNYFGGAADTLSGVMEAVEKTQVTYVHWAQFMESTAGDDPYGLIEKNGHVKAAYNALKAYNDMPVWRYNVEFNNEETGLKAVSAASEDKISMLVWNTEDEEKAFSFEGQNAPFKSGTMRVYRIDEEHASYFDTKEEELIANITKEKVNTQGTVWRGIIPAHAVVYITVNKDKKAVDFKREWTDFAKDIKTQYFFEDRFKKINGSYAHFQRNNWTTYLGMGDNDEAHANVAVIVEKLPDKFSIDFKTEGEIKQNDINSALGFRMDFHTSDGYTKSVYFHNGIYNEDRTADLAPWGDGKAPDVVVKFEGDITNIKLSDYTPSNFDGRAQLSFHMQNTGAGTRARLTLNKISN